MNSMRALWKGIKNNVSLKSRNLDAVPHVLYKNGSEVEVPEQIANQFNHFFTSVAEDT